MYYNYNTNAEDVDIYQLKRLPQFAKKTDHEIREFISKINRVEMAQWVKDAKATLDEHRRKDLAYIEEHSEVTHPQLPVDPVQIDRGVTVTHGYDDHGFISDTDLATMKRHSRLSLNPMKKIYI